MKNKKIFFIMVILCTSCNSGFKNNTSKIWLKRKVFKYSIKMPPSYTIDYLPDSAKAKITNGSVIINCLDGYFNAINFRKFNNIFSDSQINSFKKIIYDSTSSGKTSVAVYLLDTVHSLHLFQDLKYKGCVMVSDGLIDKQKDTVLEIFKSLNPEKSKK